MFERNNGQTMYVGHILIGRKIRSMMEKLGLLFLVVTSICLFIVWFMAYFSDAKLVRVYVNLLGEAHLELIVNTFGIICIIMYLWSVRNKREMRA